MVIQMYRSIFWKARVSVIERKEVHLKLCLIINSCRDILWYVLIRPAGTTLYQLDVSDSAFLTTYSIYKEAPEDGPLRSETCRADT